jgi:hypothetical protein
MKIKRTIKKGQVFVANSNKKSAVWEVTKRIKTENENLIWCKVIHGDQQNKCYTGQQFGMLIRMGIVKLVKDGVK